MKSSVITNDKAKEHFVENYRFKILSQEKKSEEQEENLFHSEAKAQPSPSENTQNLSQNDALNLPKAPEPSFVEELLKRTDEMSGSIIKLQMQMENQESEFAKRLESEIQRAKEDGVKQGLEEAAAKFDEQLKGLENRFIASISKLEEEAAKFDKLIKNSEAELSNTAVEIAKEVVKKELSLSSSAIAANLCKELLQEIKDAKDVQIKVSLKDYKFIKQNFSGENVKISADEAINVGGVIVLSDAGNLDGTIEARFEKIKKLVGE